MSKGVPRLVIPKELTDIEKQDVILALRVTDVRNEYSMWDIDTGTMIRRFQTHSNKCKGFSICRRPSEKQKSRSSLLFELIPGNTERIVDISLTGEFIEIMIGIYDIKEGKITAEIGEDKYNEHRISPFINVVSNKEIIVTFDMKSHLWNFENNTLKNLSTHIDKTVKHPLNSRIVVQLIDRESLRTIDLDTNEVKTNSFSSMSKVKIGYLFSIPGSPDEIIGIEDGILLFKFTDINTFKVIELLGPYEGRKHIKFKANIDMYLYYFDNIIKIDNNTYILTAKSKHSNVYIFKLDSKKLQTMILPEREGSDESFHDVSLIDFSNRKEFGIVYSNKNQRKVLILKYSDVKEPKKGRFIRFPAGERSTVKAFTIKGLRQIHYNSRRLFITISFSSIGENS